MNDINWHNKDDKDFWDLLKKFNNHPIVVKTDITTRFSNTRYADECSEKMLDSDEKIVQYAFYEL